MADSASESDSSSIDGGPIMMPPSPVTREQLQKRIESLQQQNRVLKVELETYKLRVKALQEENRGLRQASVNIQAKAEQEEEFISNTLLKKIQALKKEKETLAHHYEQEEECLTNDLSRKLNQLRAEKCKLEQTLEQEQECLVNKLMRKIEKLEAETNSKQNTLEQLRREKVELENTLEQEQEALVNRLWKRMDKLEAEKRNLQTKISLRESQLSESDADSLSNTNMNSQPEDHSNNSNPPKNNSDSVTRNKSEVDGDLAALSGNVQHLRNEVDRLKAQLNIAQQQHTDKMSHYVTEERQIREENQRLHRRLQLEIERRENLCRNLSESESSLDMDDERQFHDALTHHVTVIPGSGGGGAIITNNSNQGITSVSGMAATSVPLPVTAPGSLAFSTRPASSPGPFVPSPGSGSRPMSPGLHVSVSGSRDIMMSPPSPVSKCHLCNGHGWLGGSGLVIPTSGVPNQGISSASPPIRNFNRERFARPAPPSAEKNPELRTHGDSTMSSPAPSPAPLEVVMSPAAAPSPSPMDTSSKS